MIDTDRLIDDVARRMMSGEPAADFTSRTMARIVVHRRAWAWWLVPATALTAFAVVASGWLSLSRTGHLPAVPSVASSGGMVRPALHDASLQLEAAPHRRARVNSAAEQLWESRAIPALSGPPAIPIDSIQPEALVVPLLELKPLVTEPLTVEPLGGGN